MAQWSERAGESWIKDEDLPPLTGFSGFIDSSNKKYEITENLEENESDKMTVPNRENLVEKSEVGKENPIGKYEVQSDSSVQIVEEHEAQDSISISRNIGWLLLILLVLIIVISYMINIRKSG